MAEWLSIQWQAATTPMVDPLLQKLSMVFAIMQITRVSDIVMAWFTPDPSVQYTHRRLIRKFGLKTDDSCIYLTHLNTSCRISLESGGIEEFLDAGWRDYRSYDTVMTIYDILCYHKGDAAPVFSGQRFAESFARKYVKLFDGHLGQFKVACKAYGRRDAATNGLDRSDLPLLGNAILPGSAAIWGR